jgi:hypothetical protein
MLVISMNASFDNHIATSSIEEGLDFACSLASDAISRAGVADSMEAQRLLHDLTSYVQFRYVGELLLAVEYLSSLGRACDPKGFRSTQFWHQMRWVASQMALSAEDLAKLELPDA